MVAAIAERTPTLGAARSTARSRLGSVIVVAAAVDVVVLGAAALLAIEFRFGISVWPPAQVDWLTGIPVVDFGWLIPLWLLSLALCDSYSRRQFARGSDEFKAVLRGSFLAAGLAAMLAYLLNYDMSRGYFALVFLLGTLGILAGRCAVRAAVVRLRAQGRLMHRVVVVGDRTSLREVRQAFGRHPALGYQLVAACVPSPGGDPNDGLDADLPILGEPLDAVEVCQAVAADTLLVTSSSFASSVDLRRIGWELQDQDIDLIVVPSLIDVAGPRISMRPVAGLPLLHVEPPQVDRAMRWGKAAFDRIGAVILLALTLPLLAVIAVAIKVESGDPVFYRHTRIGLRGREFAIWKFRSMVVDADHAQHALIEDHDADVLLFKVKGDPRVTRVGRFIRRYSLDELPQLFNVLVGDMSLIGPRPQVAGEVAAYDASAHRRLLVRPGMTGLWQVSGRSNLSWEEAVRLDLYYIENWSMAGDLVILAKTLRAVLRHDGAY